MSVLSMVWQWFTNFVYFIVHNVCAVLPSSPFQGISLMLPTTYDVLGWLNWLIPFKGFVQIAAVWLGCIGIYYLCMWALRLCGLID